MVKNRFDSCFSKMKEEKIEILVKRIVIGLVAAAIIVFIVASAKMYNISQDIFNQKIQKLSPQEKKAAKNLRKAGEIQSKFAGKNRTGDSKLIDEIEKNNKKKGR